jgi:hypothetical protein
MIVGQRFLKNAYTEFDANLSDTSVADGGLKRCGQMDGQVVLARLTRAT